MAVLSVELQPFRTPNFVIQKALPGARQNGFIEAPKYPIKDIPADVLSDLCDTFRAEIFSKAGVDDPKAKR